MKDVALIAAAALAFLLLLLLEKRQALNARNKLQHVVHVNGTRGKSSVTRLIEAGLRAGGLRVYGKTTGTLPLARDTEGKERLIRRLGPANVREQLDTLKAAAAQGAQVLVIECMAVAPELQKVTQHGMLMADIGVITNARPDHQEQMGYSQREVLEALSNTIPKEGLLFTGQESAHAFLSRKAARLGSRCVLARPGPRDTGDFPENQALALMVCQALGVSETDARRGFSQVREDPYSLSETVWKQSTLVNALSANDLSSTLMLIGRCQERYPELPLWLMINNRADRPERARDMLKAPGICDARGVFLLGELQPWFSRRLKKRFPGLKVRRCARAEQALDAVGKNPCLLVAIGNIQGEGQRFCDLAGLGKGAAG
jgi:poly-gamma-glutamate synthase PgsB/CapB